MNSTGVKSLCPPGITTELCGSLFFPAPPPPFPSDDNTHTTPPLVLAALMAVILSAVFLILYYCCPRNNPAPIVADDRGLDDSVIGKITVFEYRREEGLIDGSDCAVCLSEFKDEENLRLMPNCGHAFHIPCIDTWLRANPLCPICRANIN